jgi:hypothetical protein
MSLTYCNENGTINRSKLRTVRREDFERRAAYFESNRMLCGPYAKARFAREVIRDHAARASGEQHEVFVWPRFQREVAAGYTPAEREAESVATEAARRQSITWIGNQRAKENHAEAGIIRERVQKRVLERIRSEINRAT